MKFLCDNCKAKYQIADEKVAGKTVRMKCRKCGHQIEVRAAVTETSVSTSPPGPFAPRVETSRPATAKNSGLATTLAGTKPRPPAAAPVPQSGALAGAFQRTVHETPHYPPFQSQANNPVEVSVTDEWYVAINGVPVGPVRISELRRKAAAGAVNDDSLCWQEGLEEWRPVRSIPELAAIVREAAQGNRPSLVPPPNEGRISSPPRPPQRPPGAPRPPVSPPSHDPLPFLEGADIRPARSNVAPPRASAATIPDDVSPNGGRAAVAFAPWPSHAQPPPPATEAQRAPTPPPGPVEAADPFAVPPAPPGTWAAAPPVAAPQQKPSPPLWFWAVAIFAGVFAATAAFFMFRPQPTQQPPVVIQMPAPVAPTPAATTKSDDIPLPSTSGDVPPPSTASAKSASNASAKAVAAPATTPPASAKGLDLGGLGPVGGGPNVGGSGAAGSGGGGLDSSSVERVVAAHRAGVKRTCWERGGADQKSSVNVMISAQVGPSGNVVGTSSSGDDPVVAKCIESQVKSWMFSAPGSTTTVNIPFKFVRQ